MSVELRDVMMQHLDVVRHEPIGRRIRAVLDDPTVVDSSRALLVWEPKRVPSYAIPIEDVAGDLVEAESAGVGDVGVVAAAAGRTARVRPEHPVRGAHDRGHAPRRARRRSAPGARDHSLVTTATRAIASRS